MNNNPLIKLTITFTVLILSIILFYKEYIFPVEEIRLGLDLKGGSSFVLEVNENDVSKSLVEKNDQFKNINDIPSNILKDEVSIVQEIALEVIRNRIDVLGTAEPEIYPQGDSRIVVRLPGANSKDRAEAKNQISKDAVLSFKLIHQESPRWINEIVQDGLSPKGFVYGDYTSQLGPYFIRDKSTLADQDLTRDYYEVLKKLGNKTADFMLIEERLSDGSLIYRPEYVERRIRLSGDTVKNATVSYDPMSGKPGISLEFNDKGKKAFSRVTNQFSPKPDGVIRRLAIILDNKLYSAPRINEAIYGGRAEITGNFNVKEARQLVNVLRAGALPGRVDIIEERTVAPTLGKDSIDSGVDALIYGAISVLLFMLLYYLFAGLIANISLIFMSLLLPLGMWLSAGFLGVFIEGSTPGLPTLTLYGIAGIVLTVGMAVDANVLIFERMREEWKIGKSISGSITAGYNKAFSTILDANVTTMLVAVILFFQGSGPIRGFALTLSAGILVSMFVVLVLTRLIFETMANFNIIKSLKMLHIPFLTNPTFNILGGRKIAIFISIITIISSWYVFIDKAEENFGVDFTGGSVVTYEFDQKHEIEDIRSVLNIAGYPSAKIAYQSSLDGKEYLEVKIKESGLFAENAIIAIKNLTGNYLDIKNDTVGSQIGNELKKRGRNAIIFALIGIIIYISFRFEFSFAIGAIVAVIHDILITIGIFCLLGNELSMPIIAALLTIVGYSVNDTIVVFDRIREDLRLTNNLSYKEIANLAINKTLSRTLLTSVTTLITIIMLLIFGGGTVHDFASALFIGILVGTYSSIFVATPVMLLWHKDVK